MFRIAGIIRLPNNGYRVLHDHVTANLRYSSSYVCLIFVSKNDCLNVLMIKNLVAIVKTQEKRLLPETKRRNM